MKNPSVLFIQRSIPPDHSASGRIVFDLASLLSLQGFDVSLLGARLPENAEQNESISGVSVARVAALPFQRGNIASRALSLLFLYPALFFQALFGKRADVIVTLSDPPLLVLLGAIVSWLRGSRHIHWCQDLYPETAVAAGILPNGIAAILQSLSTWAMLRCEFVVTVGRCMESLVLKRGIPGEKICIIPNGANLTEIYPDPQAGRKFRQQLGFTERFVVLYSGNLGVAHSFESIVEAAVNLKKSSPDILFVFVGEGPRKLALQQLVVQKSATNFLFLPSQPLEKLPALLSSADVHLVTLRAEMTGCVVPSKVYAAIAAGRPCLFVGSPDSEAARWTQESETGLAVPEDAIKITEALRTLQNSQKREFFEKNVAAMRPRCSIESLAEKFTQILAS